MPKNILPQMPPPPPSPKKKKVKVSWMAVLFVIILTIVLIILGERFIFDLNQWFNPAYSQYSGGYPVYSDSYYPTTPSSANYDQGDYEMYRLLIHTAFAIPILLAGFLLYFWLYYRKIESPNKIIAWPYFIFSIWMTLHLVVEAFYFLIEQYEKLGIYIVLIVLVGLLTWLVLFIQKRWHQKHQLQA
ncbi:MAG: hypothetical protein WCV50_03185 [Patescibacteria group bacterium]|jgi:hypothetical protein